MGYFNFFLVKHNVNYIENYLTTCFYFVFASIFVFFIFNFEIGLISTRFGWECLILLGSFLVFKYYIFAKLKEKKSTINLDEPELMPIDYRFFISKSFEISFQVLMTAILIALLFSNGIPPVKGIILFSFVFGVAYLPLLLISSLSAVVKIFVTASFIFSGFLALLFLKFRFGLALIYMINWSFYLAFGYLFTSHEWFRKTIAKN